MHLVVLLRRLDQQQDKTKHIASAACEWCGISQWSTPHYNRLRWLYFHPLIRLVHTCVSPAAILLCPTKTITLTKRSSKSSEWKCFMSLRMLNSFHLRTCIHNYQWSGCFIHLSFCHLWLARNLNKCLISDIDAKPARKQVNPAHPMMHRSFSRCSSLLGWSWSSIYMASEW